MERQHYIDALRVLAVLLLVVFHTDMVFHPSGFHVENGEKSVFLGFLNAFIYQWHMPLFMLLAGASTWFAFAKRTPCQYVSERIRRIFVPLIFGTLALIPPQVYLERIQKGSFSGGYLDFYPSIFTTGPYPEGNLSYHHLWFLLYLFVIALLALPLLRRLGGGTLDRIGSIGSSFGGLLFVLPLPLIVSQLALRWIWPYDSHYPPTDVANLVQLAILFVAGFVIVADPRLPAAIDRYWKLALAIGLSTSATILVLLALFRHGPPRGISPLVAYAFDNVLRFLNTWLWLIALLGLGRAFLNRPSRLLRHASGIAYPYYVWHQTVILILAFFVVEMNAGVAAKWMLIALPAAAISWLLSEAVTWTAITRFLFGLGRR